MAKFLGNVVVLAETSLPALFYYKYLLESRESEIKAPPVQYYDEIDKKGIDAEFQSYVNTPMRDRHYLGMGVDETMGLINDVTKTVWHGFEYITVHENVKDEGLAKKQAQAIAKMIKNHEAPYNDIFKKYSVTIIQG